MWIGDGIVREHFDEVVIDDCPIPIPDEVFERIEIDIAKELVREDRWPDHGQIGYDGNLYQYQIDE